MNSVRTLTTFSSMLLIASGALIQTSLAQPNFVFDYSDASNGALWTTDRMTALERAATTVESLFINYPLSSIEVEVKSINDSADSTLASAGSNGNDNVLGTDSGFTDRGAVGTEILTGTDVNAGFDGNVEVNWGVPGGWDTSANAMDVAATAFDFESTMIHELLHAVGFLSGINSDGTTASNAFLETDSGPWAPFDEFVQDASGSPVISGDAINVANYTAALTGGPGSAGLRFAGPTATAANGGNPVFLYTPTTFEEGSSGSHLDDECLAAVCAPQAEYMYMMEASTDVGPGIRAISQIERAILKDIGYTQVTGLIPEPSSIVLMLMGMALLSLRRR